MICDLFGAISALLFTSYYIYVYLIFLTIWEEKHNLNLKRGVFANKSKTSLDKYTRATDVVDDN